MSRYLVATLIMITLIIVQFSLVYALPNQDVELDVEDIYWMPPTYNVKPGGVGTLVVVVKNVCSLDIRDIDATLDASDLSEDGEFEASFKGGLEPMCTALLVFKDIEISEDAKASQYHLSLKLIYRVGNYVKSRRLEVPVALAGAPEIHLYGSTIRISPNEELNFTVTVVNKGSAVARNLVVVLTSLTPFLTVTSEDQYRVDILDVAESIDLNFSIHASSSAYGSAKLRVDVAYMDELNNIYNTSRMFAAIFSVKGPQFTFISSSYIPSRVYPGDSEVSVLVTLLNSGEDKAEDVEVSLILPEGFKPTTPSSARVLPGTMIPGSPIQFKFFVDIDESATPGGYNLTLNVTYRDGIQVFNIPIQVGEKASFKLLSIAPQTIRAGDTKVKVTVNVKNTGNVDADSVSLELIGGNRITGTTVDYLGLIEAGGEKAAVFIIDVDESIPIGDFNAKINIVWIQDGKMFTQSINTTFNVLESRSWMERIKEVLNTAIFPYILVVLITLISILVILMALSGKRR